MSSDGQTKRHPGPPTALAAGFELVVTSGSDAGKTLRISSVESKRLFLGSGADADVRLDEPTVSRRHAAVESAGLRLILTDLESTNGTYVNDVSVGTAYLHGGETLRLGAASLTVALLLDEPRGPRTASSADSAAPPTAPGFGRLVGNSMRMRTLFALASRAAASELPVLIEGEIGTGKELLAEAIHEASARATGPYVVVDCAAFPTREDEIDAALFGTGAASTPARSGVVNAAANGTLVLDEVGELAPPAQARLLRVADRRSLVRIVATSTKNLDRLVEAGRFREDLLFRIAGARLEIPPLRRRDNDTQLLAAHFWRMLTKTSAIPPGLLARFVDHSWPGNVRELETAVARHIALGELASVAVAPGAGQRAASTPHAASSFQPIIDADLAFPEARQRALDLFCASYVERALANHHGNVLRAAAASGIARRYFQTIRDRGKLAR